MAKDIRRHRDRSLFNPANYRRWLHCRGESSDYNLLVFKIDNNGNITWQKKYVGSNGGSFANSVRQTADGKYIVGGVGSFGNPQSDDMWALKLDSNGSIIWQKAIDVGGLSSDYCTVVRQAADGGYVVTGNIYLTGESYSDIPLIKLDNDGNIVWSKLYGSNVGNEMAESMEQAADGGYVVGGYSESFGAGSRDFLILSLIALERYRNVNIIANPDSNAITPNISVENASVTMESVTYTVQTPSVAVSDVAALIDTICDGVESDSDNDGVSDLTRITA